MFMLLTALASASTLATAEGATMRTWHLAESMSALAPLVPGQAPNAWTQLTSLDAVHLPTRGEQVLSYIDGAFVVDRPGDDAEKRVPGSPARGRAGDGRPVDGVFPGWRVKPIDVELDGTTVALLTIDERFVVAGTDTGSIWYIDLDEATASRFAADLPRPLAMESAADGGLLVAHADGTLLLRDSTGDGLANDEQDVQTLVPPGPRRVVENGVLRSRHGTVIAPVDASTGIDRLLCEFEAPDGRTYVLLGAPDELFGGVIDRIEGRERATLTRMSAPSAYAATVIMPRGIVLSTDDGLQLMEESNADPLYVKHVEPMANGLRVRMSEALSREVLANPEHYDVVWVDAVGERTALSVASASPLFDGSGSFLEVDRMPIPGTAHVRFVGPWRSLDGDVLWSPEAWASVHVPLPARTGTVVPHVRPRHNDLSPREELDGWTLLFDGQDASKHWRGFKKDALPGQWVSEGGELVYTGAGGGDIVTRDKFDDFSLSLEWMVHAKGNSGIFFNVAEDGAAVWSTGPEMQILDNSGHADGRSALTSAGSNYALHAPPFDPSLPPGRWNLARIRVVGDHAQYWLNGVKTADYHLQSPAWKARVADSKFAGMPRYGTETSGHIALQDHGDRVAFRNIRIKRLDGGLSDE